MTALRPIKKKIQSERGASITFALLLFLVCAVVGSAVLTAGTAAGGRMSQVAEMDQSYYSVSSAARVLINMVEKEDAVTVIEKRTLDPATGKESVEYTMDDGSPNGMDLEESPEFNSLARDAAYRAVMKETKPVNMTLSANADGHTEAGAALKTKIRMVVDGSNPDEDSLGKSRMIMEITSDGGSGKPYALRLTFNIDMQETAGRQGSKTVITRKIKWHIRDVDVISAATIGG